MYKNQKLITKAMVPIVQIMNSCLEKNDSVNNRLFDLASDAFSMMAYAHRVSVEHSETAAEASCF